MRARPYQLVSDALLTACKLDVEASLQQWAQDWGISRNRIRVQVDRIELGRAPDPDEGWAVLAPGCWFRPGPDLEGVLHATIFPPGQAEPSGPPGPISTECISAAVSSLKLLLQRLACRHEVAGFSLADAADLLGRGWISLNLRCGDAVVEGICSAFGIRAEMAGSPGELRDRLSVDAMKQAARGAQARCPIELGSTDLALSDLLSLKPGDVVVLQQDIEQPLRMVLPGPGCSLPVHLGRRGSQRAVQLVGPPER